MLEVNNEYKNSKFGYCEKCGSAGVVIPDDEWFFLFNRDIFVPPVYCQNENCENHWKSEISEKIIII